jgi:hypothetical protein
MLHHDIAIQLGAQPKWQNVKVATAGLFLKVAENTHNNQIITWFHHLEQKPQGLLPCVSIMFSAYQPTCSTRALQWKPLSRRRRQLEMERRAVGMGGDENALRYINMINGVQHCNHPISFCGIKTILYLILSTKMSWQAKGAGTCGPFCTQVSGPKVAPQWLDPMAHWLNQCFSQLRPIRYPQKASHTLDQIPPAN